MFPVVRLIPTLKQSGENDKNIDSPKKKRKQVETPSGKPGGKSNSQELPIQAPGGRGPAAARPPPGSAAATPRSGRGAASGPPKPRSDHLAPRLLGASCFWCVAGMKMETNKKHDGEHIPGSMGVSQHGELVSFGGSNSMFFGPSLTARF